MCYPATMRSLLVAAALSLVAGCSAPAPLCSTATCPGCCDDCGQCQAGVDRMACGLRGVSCRRCALSDDCVSGSCMAPFGSPTGGGSAGGEATAGGNTSGGSTAGGNAAGGNAAGGNTAGGNAAGGNAAGGGAVFLPDGGPAFCNLPQDRLRFGNVTLGTSRAVTFSVDNPTSQPLEVTINPSSGAYSTSRR